MSHTLEMMAERSLRVEYHGPAVAEGRIDVRDLAPALLSLADLFREINQIATPGAPSVSLDVHATERASFDIGLLLHVAETLIDGFDHLHKLYVLLFGGAVVGGGGLFEFIRRRGVRRIVERTPTPDGEVRVRFDDGAEMTVSAKTLEAHDSVSVRRNARRVVRPLGHEGIDWMEVRSEDLEVRVDRDEVPAFDIVDIAREELPAQEQVVYLNVISPTFKEGNKWRFSDGARNLWAVIEDSVFLRDVDEGRLRFGKGDQIHGTLELRQYRADDGNLTSEYVVTEVHQVYRPGDQMQLEEG